MKLILFLILFLSFQNGFSQQNDFPKNPKVGKCYQRCPFKNFNYNKIFKENVWVEIDCSLVKKNMGVKNDVQKNPEIVRFTNYQKLLKKLGYNIIVTNILDKQTIKAHNKNLKDQRKARRKKRKILNKL